MQMTKPTIYDFHVSEDLYWSFLELTPHGLVGGYQHFGGIYCLT
jgi:hypothetical protein